MTGIRRALLLAGLTLTVILGAGIPASAGFGETVSFGAQIGTLTVAAPTQVEATGPCITAVDPLTGAVTSTVYAKIEWHRSATKDVTGYRVTAYWSDGSSSVVAQTGAADDEVFRTFDLRDLVHQPRFSVTTLTSYGWTAESPRTAALSC